MPITNITVATDFSDKRQYCRGQQHFKISSVIKAFNFKAKITIENIDNEKHKRYFKNNV